MTQVTLGFQINADAIKAVALDPETQEIEFEVTRAQSVSGNPATDYETLLDTVGEMAELCRDKTGSLTSLVAAVSGIVHPATQEVRSNLISFLNGRPFHEDLTIGLKDRLGQSVRVSFINDAKVAAWYEVKQGICAQDEAGKKEHTIVGLLADHGLGAGIITDGKINFGKDGAFGEIGQLPAFPFSEYQKMVCLSHRRASQTPRSYLIVADILSLRGLSRFNEIYRGDSCTVSRFKQDLEAGDEAAHRVYDRFTSVAAEAFATFVFATNPDAFVLSGGLSQLPGFVEGINKNLGLMARRDERFNVPVLPSRYGASSAVRGAALWNATRQPL